MARDDAAERVQERAGIRIGREGGCPADDLPNARAGRRPCPRLWDGEHGGAVDELRPSVAEKCVPSLVDVLEHHRLDMPARLDERAQREPERERRESSDEAGQLGTAAL